MLSEIEKAICNRKQEVAAWSDGPTSEILRDDGPSLASRLTEILDRI